MSEIFDQFSASSKQIMKHITELKNKIEKMHNDIQESINSNHREMMDYHKSREQSPIVAQEELKHSQEDLVRKIDDLIEIKSDQESNNTDMYSFLSSLDSLQADEFRFAQNFKHKMLHPYKMYHEETPLESMDYIEATLLITALY